MNVNSFQDRENVTPCRTKQMPSIGQEGTSRLSIDQALLKYFPSTVEPRFSDHIFSDKLRFSDTFSDNQFSIK